MIRGKEDLFNWKENRRKKKPRTKPVRELVNNREHDKGK